MAGIRVSAGGDAEAVQCDLRFHGRQRDHRQGFATHLFKKPTQQPELEWPSSPTLPAIAETRINLASLLRAFYTIAFAYGLIITLRNDLAPKATVITHTYADVTPSNTPYTFPGIKTGPWI